MKLIVCLVIGSVEPFDTRRHFVHDRCPSLEYRNKALGSRLVRFQTTDGQFHAQTS